MDDSGARRPRDLALLLLAAEERAPRQRARDQRADLAGDELRRQLLDRIVALDPEPESLRATLEGIARDHPGASGPTRALAVLFQAEWDMILCSPTAWEWLLDQALAAAEPGRRGPRRGGQSSDATP